MKRGVIAILFTLTGLVAASDPQSDRRFEVESRYEDVTLAGIDLKGDDERVKRGMRVDLDIFWGKTEPLHYDGGPEWKNLELVTLNRSAGTITIRVKSDLAPTLRRAFREALVDVYLHR